LLNQSFEIHLPLPSQPLLNTGTHGPLLEEIQELHISDDEFEAEPRAGPASPPPKKAQFRPTSDTGGGSRPDSKNMVTDITPYKTWTCIYPIYVDAKRPYGRGQRRVERAKSLWWPLSKDIAEAANRLGLGTLHEVNKSHPRDWDNPGRVRVQWKKDGRLLNPMVKTKKQLLEMICYQIQLQKPEHIPKPPFNTTPSSNVSIATSNPAPISSNNKGKQPAMTKSKSPAPPSYTKKASGRQLPIPPEPLPPLTSRVSPYSPAISTGVLIDTVKAGMNANDANALGTGAPGGAGMGSTGKGKRKVIRVRG